MSTGTNINIIQYIIHIMIVQRQSRPNPVYWDWCGFKKCPNTQLSGTVNRQLPMYFNRCLFLKSTTVSFLTESLAIFSLLLKNTLIIDLVAKSVFPNFYGTQNFRKRDGKGTQFCEKRNQKGTFLT